MLQIQLLYGFVIFGAEAVLSFRKIIFIER